jgi:hypothetical protein
LLTIIMWRPMNSISQQPYYDQERKLAVVPSSSSFQFFKINSWQHYSCLPRCFMSNIINFISWKEVNYPVSQFCVSESDHSSHPLTLSRRHYSVSVSVVAPEGQGRISRIIWPWEVVQREQITEQIVITDYVSPL